MRDMDTVETKSNEKTSFNHVARTRCPIWHQNLNLPPAATAIACTQQQKEDQEPLRVEKTTIIPASGGNRTYCINEDTRSEILLDGLSIENFRDVPLSSTLDAGIKVFETLHLSDQEASSAAKYALLKSWRDLPFMLGNAMTALGAGAYLGLGVTHTYSQAKIHAIDNLALGTLLLQDWSTDNGPFHIVATPTPETERVYKSELQRDRSLDIQEYKMPEAAWTFRLELNGTLFARIGMNLHRELDTVVASITNIQGLDKKTIRALRSTKIHTEPIMWPQFCLNKIIQQLPDAIGIIRGVPVEFHPASFREGFSKSRLEKRYDGTFSALDFQPISWDDFANKGSASCYSDEILQLATKIPFFYERKLK